MGIRACAVLRRKRLLVGRLPVPTPRLTGVGLPPHGSVDGGRAPHGPRRVVHRHNDVAGSEVLQVHDAEWEPKDVEMTAVIDCSACNYKT